MNIYIHFFYDNSEINLSIGNFSLYETTMMDMIKYWNFFRYVC